MTTKEMVQSQFELIFATVAANTEGMTQDESLASPGAGGNCANWILGHLTNVQNQLMGLLGADPVWADAGLDRDWNDPVASPDEALDFGAMREAFLGSKDRLMAAVGAQPPESLGADVPNPLGGTITREGLMGLLAFHQAYHAGQLALARRVAGHEGVFKQPGN